jgi:hypothetical protein
MARIVANKGIATQFTNRYSSASNGIAERGIKSILGTVRAMLINANLPHEYWGEAAVAAAYITNRMPTAGNPDNKTPFEMLYGHVPDISNLRAFGSKAYVHLHPQERQSSGPAATTSIEGIMVGFATRTNGYRVILRNFAVIESAEVSFQEATFPGELTPDALLKLPFEQIEQQEEWIDIAETPKTPAEPEEKNTEQQPANPEEEGHNFHHHLAHLLKDELFAPRTRRPPAYLEDYITIRRATEDAGCTALAAKISYAETIKDPAIVAAMRDEFTHLFDSGAIKVVPLPKDRKAISCTVAHKRKTDTEGNFTRIKSRLCPHGFRQIPGIDYDEDRVSAPTLHMESSMLVLCIEAQRGMASTTVDADSAFATTPNHKTTYMDFPKGMKTIPCHALLLTHSLNGTKQGAHDWHRRAHDALSEMDFKASAIEPCLYHKWKQGAPCMVALYVDDFRIMYVMWKMS